MNRKEWLKGEIQALNIKELWDELDEADRIFLDSYRANLKRIELKEKGLWRENKTG